MSRYLVINPARCQGHARCFLFAAPDLLSGDGEGFVSQRGERVLIPEDLFAQAELAEESCPEQAISIEES